MIILSARKFRDNQNEILRKALTEEVILTTLHYGNFRLVPIQESGQTVVPDRPSEMGAKPPVDSGIQKVSRDETFVEPRSSWVPESRSSAPVDMTPDASFEASQAVEIPVEREITPAYEQSVPEDRKGEVYVDPSLLTLEEFYEREGIDIGNKKKGIFGKMFSKK